MQFSPFYEKVQLLSYIFSLSQMVINLMKLKSNGVEFSTKNDELVEMYVLAPR